jgi:hypothetical protein
MLHMYLDSQCLWGHLTVRTPRPSISVRPEEPTTGADGAPPSDEAQVAYTEASEQYMFDLSDYEDWATDKAHVTQIILGSMKVEFAMDLASLPSTQEMWARVTELYQSMSHALYISVLELASSIRQQDSSVDAFYRQLTDVWCQLDSLAPAYCRSCDCCRLRQEYDGVIRLHEFLRRLRPEFEQLQAQLQARSPLPTMVEASPWLGRRRFAFVVFSRRLPRFWPR